MVDSTTLTILSGTTAPQGSLLATKLYIPSRRPNLVLRPRLTARLNLGLERKLTLISAPAGFGKTTLLSEWLHLLKGANQNQPPQHQGSTINDNPLLPPSSPLLSPSPTLPPSPLPPSHPPTLPSSHPPTLSPPIKIAWLSLDSDDDDPARFWLYFIAALQTIQPDLGQAALAGLNSPQPPALEPALTLLVNELAAIAGDVVFVLDDYHVIEAESIHRGLTFLLDHIPPQMRLIITSRTDPPLPLARLRAQGQLLELRASDLRFTEAEAAAFLNRVMGLQLSTTDIATLEDRTEGWIAGLQLAALSMQGREDIPGFIAAFTGSHRYILDYLAEEVLRRQPQAVQTFLLQTSVLNRLTGSLVEAVTGLADGQATLARLEQANLFLIPLDDERRWYRYHHLFADLLRHLLDQTQPGQVVELHRQAAAWYERHGFVAEAMSHALTAGDAERAVRLFEQNAGTLLSRSEMNTLLSWLEALPVELVRSRPRLSLFQAWALVLTGQLEAVEALLENGSELQGVTYQHSRLETHNPELEPLLGEIAAVRATVAYFRRNLPQAIELYRQALEALPEDNLFLRGAVALSLGVAYSWSGDIAGASQALAEASAISQATGNLHVALTAMWNLAQLHMEQGQLQQAASLYQQALQLALASAKSEKARSASSLLPAAGGVYVGLGSLHYEQNDLERAASYLMEGIKLGEQGADVGIMTLGYIALARLKQAQANPAGALAALQKAEQLAQRYNSTYWTAQVAMQQARLRLAHANLRAAELWAQKFKQQAADKLNDPDGAGRITLARVLLAQGNMAEAGELLAHLGQLLAVAGRTGRVIEVLILQALAEQAKGDIEKAFPILQRALALAEPAGYIRLFVDEGPPLAALLRQAAAQGIAPDYAGQLLAAFEGGERGSRSTAALQPGTDSSTFSPAPLLPRSSALFLVEPLSERELEILHLIEAGLSNQEIAGKLILTVGTVKWHLNNIYGKLQVRSRTQAVARARELALL